MTEQQVRRKLAAHVERAGGVRALAREWGMPPSLISDCMNLRREPSASVLGPMGLDRVVWVTYRIKSETPTGA